MPIYEYRCDKCETVFEEWHRHADDDQEKPCPQCSAVSRRLISNTSFMLKGGGWYVTEYGNRKSASSGDKAGGDTPAKSEPAPAEKAPATSAAAD